VRIQFTIAHETDKAILIDHDDRDVWLPKSQLSEVVISPEGVWSCEIPDWLYEKHDDIF
jgi:hypothetical protein